MVSNALLKSRVNYELIIGEQVCDGLQDGY